MNYTVSQISEAGGRPPNEDSVQVFSSENGCVWVVADGLGGHVHGEQASALAVKMMVEKCQTGVELSDDFINDCFETTNKAVAELEGPLTTLVCAFEKDGEIRYANVGDSRLYFIRGGHIEHTDDHSMAYVSYKLNDITYDQIRFDPAQSRLLRAIGSTKTSCVQLYPSIELKPDDGILLCSDGFWELVYEEEVVEDLALSDSADEWLTRMITRLEKRLTNTSDNYTAIAVLVK